MAEKVLKHVSSTFVSSTMAVVSSTSGAMDSSSCLSCSIESSIEAWRLLGRGVSAAVLKVLLGDVKRAIFLVEGGGIATEAVSWEAGREDAVDELEELALELGRTLSGDRLFLDE